MAESRRTPAPGGLPRRAQQRFRWGAVVGMLAAGSVALVGVPADAEVITESPGQVTSVDTRGRDLDERRSRPTLPLGAPQLLYDGSRRVRGYFPLVEMTGPATATAMWVRSLTRMVAVEFDTSRHPDPPSPREILVDVDADESVEIPQLDSDSAGSLTAAWIEHRRLGDGPELAPPTLVTATRQNGDWSAPTTVATGTSSGYRLAVAPSGAAILVWSRRAGDFSVSRPPSGGAWGPVERLPRRVPGSLPPVGIDDKGRALVVFQGARDRVLYMRRVPGTGWQEARVLQAGNPFTAGATSAVNARGVAVALWVRVREADAGGDVFDTELRFARMRPNGTWRKQAFTVDTGRSVGVSDDDRAVAISDTGRAVAAWLDGRGRLHAAGSDKTGRWRAPALLARHAASGHNDPEDGLKVTFDDPARPLVTWLTGSNRDDGVAGSVLIGRSWTPARRLTPRDTPIQEWRIDATALRRAVVVYRTRSESVYGRAINPRD